jgi:putative sterol carrier protein
MNERIDILAKEPPNKYLSAGWDGTYLIDTGDSGRSRFKVHDGQIEVLDPDGEAECRLECSYEDAMKFMDGSLNMVTALLRGQLRIAGDLGLAQRLHSYIRAANYAALERNSR